MIARWSLDPVQLSLFFRCYPDYESIIRRLFWKKGFEIFEFEIFSTFHILCWAKQKCVQFYDETRVILLEIRKSSTICFVGLSKSISKKINKIEKDHRHYYAYIMNPIIRLLLLPLLQTFLSNLNI